MAIEIFRPRRPERLGGSGLAESLTDLAGALRAGERRREAAAAAARREQREQARFRMAEEAAERERLRFEQEQKDRERKETREEIEARYSSPYDEAETSILLAVANRDITEADGIRGLDQLDDVLVGQAEADGYDGQLAREVFNARRNESNQLVESLRGEIISRPRADAKNRRDVLTWERNEADREVERATKREDREFKLAERDRKARERLEEKEEDTEEKRQAAIQADAVLEGRQRWSTYRASSAERGTDPTATMEYRNSLVEEVRDNVIKNGGTEATANAAALKLLEDTKPDVKAEVDATRTAAETRRKETLVRGKADESAAISTLFANADTPELRERAFARMDELAGGELGLSPTERGQLVQLGVEGRLKKVWKAGKLNQAYEDFNAGKHPYLNSPEMEPYADNISDAFTRTFSGTTSATASARAKEADELRVEALKQQEMSKQLSETLLDGENREAAILEARRNGTGSDAVNAALEVVDAVEDSNAGALHARLMNEPEVQDFLGKVEQAILTPGTDLSAIRDVLDDAVANRNGVTRISPDMYKEKREALVAELLRRKNESANPTGPLGRLVDSSYTMKHISTSGEYNWGQTPRAVGRRRSEDLTTAAQTAITEAVLFTKLELMSNGTFIAGGPANQVADTNTEVLHNAFDDRRGGYSEAEHPKAAEWVEEYFKPFQEAAIRLAKTGDSVTPMRFLSRNSLWAGQGEVMHYTSDGQIDRARTVRAIEELNLGTVEKVRVLGYLQAVRETTDILASTRRPEPELKLRERTQ